MADENGEPESLRCKITAIQFDHQERNDFLWLKNSCQSDTFVGQQEDGVIVVLRIKENGFVARFVLDPSLTCAFWDNEEIKSHCQNLFAQHKNGGILMYTVDTGGVTETIHIPSSKLSSLIEHSQHSPPRELQFHLVGCDQGLVVLNVGDLYTACVLISSSGVLQLQSLIPLPVRQGSSANDSSSPDISWHSVCHVVGGFLAVLDSQANMIFLHSIQLGNCVCQIDILSFISERSILRWRLSSDHSTLFFLDTQFCVTKINLMEYADEKSGNVNWMDSEERERTHRREHYKNRLCHFGDSAWRKEAVSYHAASSKSGKIKTERKVNGFKAANIKKSPAKRRIERPSVQVSNQSLKLDDVKDDGWAVIAMEASSTTATVLVERRVAVKEKAVCFVNFSDAASYLHRLPEPSCLVLSDTSSLHILWTESFLMYISPNSGLQKDDLISWMMAYSGPGAADALCQANHWTRTTIPLSALVSSLQQRQLETLTFYFKSKQGLFSTWKQSQQPVKLRNEIQEMENVLHLVSKTVADGIADPQARIFARRLLSLTMDFLYSQLEDARDCLNTLICEDVNILEEMKIEVHLSCTVILRHVSALRKNMHLLENRTSQTKGALLSDVEKPQEEVDHGSDSTLEQYAKENKLSKLQALLQKNGGNVKSHEQIVSQLLDIVKKYIEQRDIASCQQILNNLGCEIIDTLWRLSQFYTERGLQEFITGQLSSSASLTSSQNEVVEFMHKLYQAYPNGSFNKALKAKNDKNSSLWTDDHKRLKNVIVSSSVFLPSQCGEVSSGVHKDVHEEEPDCSSNLYTSIPLAWLNEWTDSMKRSVLTEAEVLTTDDEESILKVEAEGLWKFLASHNMLNTLETVVTKSSSHSSHKWPSDPVACVQLGWSHLQKEIFSLLLRLKALDLSSCKSRGVDMQLLLRMVGGPLQRPHPLAYAGNTYLKQFHALFINYCVRCGLQLPLWMYCSIHNIDVRDIKVEENPVWFQQFQLFFSIPRDPKDTSNVLLASQMAASGLWSPSSPSNPMNVEAMLNEGQIMAAIATLSYMKQEDVALNSETVEKYLQPFPKLKSILLPDSPNASAKPKMTVYQLLLGNVPFNVRRLFGWHSHNSIAGEDSPRAMPQFSDASVQGVLPTQQKLAFTYYLKQGRPMYAFLAFLVDELDKREESVSEKRINQACGACLWVAVQNFAESRVTSACVVFVEMLGRDSGLVRTMIHAGRLLLSSKIKTINPHDNDDTRKEKTRAFASTIAQDLQACVQSRRRFGPKLIMSVEALIASEIKDENLRSTSFEASQKWTMVNMLCHLLHLPMSTVYLKACAEADNWLMFVWYAQLHQYPSQQLQGLLHSFKSIHYRDHLHYVLNNAESKLFSSSSLSSSVASTVSSSVTSNEKRLASQRSALYNKIGVKNDNTARSSSDEEEEVKETPPVLSSFSSRLRHSEFHESEMPESMAPDDVFRMLFHSQAMPCQWRCLLAAAVSLSNPLFAELAACCGCPAVPSVCGWLLSSMESSVKQDFLNHHGQMVSKWTVDKLELLIDVALDGQREDALATVFFLMQNKSPLYPFFCFINECMERGHHAASKTYIDQFKDAMATFENQVDPDNPESGSNGELSIIGDRGWIEKVVYQVIIHILQHCKKIYRACRFLELLDKHNLSLVFRFDVLNFRHLHQVVKLFHENDITDVNLVSLLTSGTKSPSFEAECKKAVDFLVKNGKYSKAMELARLTDISKEKVILEQLREEKHRLTKCGLWTAKYVRAQFWDRSCQMLKSANSSFSACEQFFQAQLDGTKFEYEKALVCQHWFSLLEDSDDPDIVCKRENIFRNMWRHRIAAKMSLEEQEALDHIFENVKPEEKQRYLKSDLVLTEVKSLDVSDVQEDLSAPELEILDTLMGSYLEQSQVNACARVASVFGYYSQDLAIIETCIALSCGKNTIENIEPAMRRLVAKVTLKRRLSSFSKARSISSCSLDSLNSTNADDRTTSSKVQETLKVMEKLCEHCKKGRQVCRRIITCFKIAEILDVPYQEIVQVQEFDTLHRLLVTDHMDKFFLAREFLFTSGLVDEEVTQFLAGLILETLRSIVSRHIDTKSKPDKGLNFVKPLLVSTDGMEVFGHFIKLSENASLLGDKILQAVASLTVDDGSEMVPAVLTIQTEMIILAHDCYTNASNMEGISHVLRAARVCCHGLAQAGEFFLMIRLLTGVGRYSEMQFVFHLLQQHHQFELLLRKGMDREDKLKVAILEYLKRYQPEDSDAYSMVALKFSMYRDIAGLLEKCGHRALRQMKAKTLENNKETVESLKKCLQYFQEAAESYVKDMSVRKAQRCIKMARLLSLQQQLLANGACVINLSRDEVLTFVSNHTRFIESMVVTDAYEQKVNWRDAIYNNVLVGGDLRYLQELKLHVHITPTLVEDVLHKCKSSNSKSGVNMTGVRKLLGHCKDAQLQYKLASELGISDMVSAMLKGDSGNYLQDVTMV